jgi:hypothetical protein
LRSLFGPALLLAILGCVTFVYSEGTFDANYQGDDYSFISQGARLGLAKSITIPYKNLFIPFYRLVMGALHVLFENAIPIRIAILLFHLANTALIYHIVRGHTRSITLAIVASATFGLSRQSASTLLFPINGHCVMSLTFVLAMSIYFDRFLQSQSSPGLKTRDESEKTEEDASPEIPNASGAQPTTRDLTDITMQPDVWRLQYYYVGLLFFALGLGFSTIALAGGIVIWGFTYVRLLRERSFRQSLDLQAKTVLPFIAVISAYMLMRSHFTDLSRPYLDSMTGLVMDRPNVGLIEVMKVIAKLPVEFYTSAIEQTLPYFKSHYIIALAILALLLVKEIVFRKKEGGVVVMWLGFAALSIAMPSFGRLFFILRGGGAVENLLFPWYFYIPVAGVSIALGLLLRSPPALEKKAEGFSTLRQTLLLSLVVAILAALNFSAAKEIRAFIPPLIDENARFNNLLGEYKRSMGSFVQAPAYAPDRQYHFKDTVSAGQGEFPMSWHVMQRDIFYLYFPDMKNVRFISGFRHHGDLYFWSPDGIVKRHWRGWL